MYGDIKPHLEGGAISYFAIKIKFYPYFSSYQLLVLIVKFQFQIINALLVLIYYYYLYLAFRNEQRVI